MYKHMTKNDYANSKENRREIGNSMSTIIQECHFD